MNWNPTSRQTSVVFSGLLKGVIRALSEFGECGIKIFIFRDFGVIPHLLHDQFHVVVLEHAILWSKNEE
jgi:hypothetical protein